MTDKQTDLNYYAIPVDFLPLNVAIYRYEDDDFIFVDLNKQAQETEKIKKEDVLGKKLCDIFLEVKAFGLYEVLLRIHAQGGHETFEQAFYKDDRISGWRKNEIIKLSNGDIMAIYEDLSLYKKTADRLQLLGTILDNTMNEVFIFDTDTLLFTYVNQAAQNNIGYNLEELLRMTPVDIKPKYSMKNFLSLLEPLRNGKQNCLQFETLHRRKNGSDYYAEIRLQLIQSEDKMQFVVIAHDVTEEHKKAELLQLQALIIDSVEDSIVVHDAKGKFIYLNESAWKSRGYSYEEMMQMSVKELDAPEYSNGNPEQMKAIIEQMKKQGWLRLEVEHICKNGDSLPVEVYAKQISLHNKPYVLSSIRDISERKIAQKALEESENKYRNLVEKAMIGIYRSDLMGNILYLNQALANMLGFDSPNELIGKKSALRYNDPKQREVLIQRLLQEGFFSSYELELLDKDKNTVPVMVSAALNGNILSGMIIDMRELNKSREEIDKLSTVVEQINDSVVITERSGKITYVNQAFCNHMGYTKEEVLGEYPSMFRSDRHDDEFYAKLWRTILDGEVFRGTIVNVKKNGELYYEDKNITPLKDNKNNIVGFVSSGKDVTKETLLHQEIERIATIDKLTGLYNRHKFEELFIFEAERSNRFSLPLSMIMIDIDHFKSVNDTYGHDVGDEVLKHLSNTVQINIRKIDILARWGGEEFLVLCPGTDLKHTRKLAEKLCQAVDYALFPVVGHITISLGVSTYEEHETFSEFFKHADQGLYYAKEHGRNQVG